MTREDAINLAANGNADAATFLLRVIRLAHIWDDLVDRDRQVSDELINEAFLTALVWLPSNPFYLNNFNYLYPIISSAVSSWLVATQLERAPQDEVDTQIAFITRSDYINVVLAVARICGGHDHELKIAPVLRRYWHEGGHDKYLSELRKERADRSHFSEVAT